MMSVCIFSRHIVFKKSLEKGAAASSRKSTRVGVYLPPFLSWKSTWSYCHHGDNSNPGSITEQPSVRSRAERRVPHSDIPSYQLIHRFPGEDTSDEFIFTTAHLCVSSLRWVKRQASAGGHRSQTHQTPLFLEQSSVLPCSTQRRSQRREYSWQD